MSSYDNTSPHCTQHTNSDRHQYQCLLRSIFGRTAPTCPRIDAPEQNFDVLPRRVVKLATIEQTGARRPAIVSPGLCASPRWAQAPSVRGRRWNWARSRDRRARSQDECSTTAGTLRDLTGKTAHDTTTTSQQHLSNCTRQLQVFLGNGEIFYWPDTILDN